jgi:hypothetical protein
MDQSASEAHWLKWIFSKAGDDLATWQKLLVLPQLRY